ncbi:MAG: DUF6054 family protein [Clostridiaceae bacterium]|nr:DUF6054 family protein [Clostridiaceae bacterium]
MATVTLSGPGRVSDIAGVVKSGIQNSGISCELIDTVSHGSGDFSVVVMVFEKYFWRASNRASLTVVVSGAGDRVTVEAIGSGGGQGPLLRFSWGAEDSFAETVAEVLRPYGFR